MWLVAPKRPLAVAGLSLVLALGLLGPLSCGRRTHTSKPGLTSARHADLVNSSRVRTDTTGTGALPGSVARKEQAANPAKEPSPHVPLQSHLVLVDGRYRCMTAGSLAIRPQINWENSFSDDRVPVRDTLSGKWGFIDMTGKLVVEPKFGWAFDFSEGLAAVLDGDWNAGKFGYIDTTGRFVIEPQFGEARQFHDGLAAVRVGARKRDKWGYIDTTGRFVIKPRFADAGDFSDRLAPVAIRPLEIPFDHTLESHFGFSFSDLFFKRWGFMNKAGRFVIKPQFAFANEFRHGEAEVEYEEIWSTISVRYAVIDTTGKVIRGPSWAD